MKNINYLDHPYWTPKCLNIGQISIPYWIFLYISPQIFTQIGWMLENVNISIAHNTNFNVRNVANVRILWCSCRVYVWQEMVTFVVLRKIVTSGTITEKICCSKLSTDTYMSVVVHEVVGEFEFIEGDDLFHPLCAFSWGILMHVNSTRHLENNVILLKKV